MVPINLAMAKNSILIMNWNSLCAKPKDRKASLKREHNLRKMSESKSMEDIRRALVCFLRNIILKVYFQLVAKARNINIGLIR
jgi:hypothetical protein